MIAEILQGACGDFAERVAPRVDEPSHQFVVEYALAPVRFARAGAAGIGERDRGGAAAAASCAIEVIELVDGVRSGVSRIVGANSLDEVLPE